MSTAALDNSSLTSTQSLAVGQRQKVLGGGWHHASTYLHGNPSYLLQMSRQCAGNAAVVLAAVGQRGTTRVHEERATQGNQPEWVLKGLDLDALMGFQNFP